MLFAVQKLLIIFLQKNITATDFVSNVRVNETSTNDFFKKTGPEDIKFISCSTQLSIKFFLLINVEMPIIVGILTFISGNYSFLCLSEPTNAEFLDIFILMSI